MKFSSFWKKKFEFFQNIKKKKLKYVLLRKSTQNK